MFKEKRNKGFISVLILSLVFFAIASISGFLGQMHKKPTEGFADTTDTGKEVTMSVYGIYPEPVGEVDGGTVVYIVQYGKEGEGKFAVVESKVKDESINKLLDNADSLAENPSLIPILSILRRTLRLSILTNLLVLFFLLNRLSLVI